MRGIASKRRGTRNALQLAMLVIAAACSMGCAVIAERYTLEESFLEKEVRSIRDGQTTKKEILHRFGPPLAVVRSGAVVKIPRPGIITTGSRDMPAEDVFSLFPEAAGRSKDAFAYYYRDMSLVWYDLIFYDAGFPTRPDLVVEELWILIDGQGEKVVAHKTERTSYETCGLWIWCRDDQEPRPTKGAGSDVRPADHDRDGKVNRSHTEAEP